jgi:hypothetical protein
MQRGRLHVIGVRHHSPACARLVAATIRRLKPRAVLIEGPADMNGRLDELRLPHRLPVAVFSFVRAGDATSTSTSLGEGVGSFSPFCQTSPEWQALHAGHEVGADVRFMDLPAWDKAFLGVENRYSDGQRRHNEAIKRLCARFHIDGYDALWDHLFESAPQAGLTDDEAAAALEQRLDAYFVALRNDEDGGQRDGPREAFMRRFLRAALREYPGDDDVVVAVCGGYHATALLDPFTDDDVIGREPAGWPEAARPEGAESYLVPWSFKRLDAFTGYAAGMPSPGYYDDVFSVGVREAGERGLKAIVTELREKNVAVSAADVIATRTMSEGLARLRGHPAVLRTDLLDGVAAALVKESLDVPLPWAERGPLQHGSDALLSLVVQVLSGERQGRLAPGTPQPPLVKDVEDTLEAMKLTPSSGPSRTEKLRLMEPAALGKSRVLHRLRVLSIPGFKRASGPRPGVVEDAALLEERWVIADHPDRVPGIIEAAAFGATLESAAAARLEALFLAPDLDLEATTNLLGEAVLVGLTSLTGRALSAIRRHAARETDLARLGGALHRLLGLFRTDALFGARHRPELQEGIVDVYERGLWLLEQVTGVSSSSDGRIVDAIRALRDCAREPRTGVNTEELTDVCLRRADAEDAPPAVRGACLGVLWSMGLLGRLQHEATGRHPAVDDDTGTDNNTDNNTRQVAIDAVRRMARPTLLGDFLAGLFALAREEVVMGEDVIGVVDEAVAGLPEQDFLIALPALRLAFSFFPPREKVSLAERIAGRHGSSRTVARDLLHLEVDATTTVSGRAVDEAVQQVLLKYGLWVATGTATETASSEVAS